MVPDPYSAGTDPRPWLVLAAEALPYAGEEYICAGPTLSDLPANVEVADGDWIVGTDPAKTTFCWPWVLGNVKHDAIGGIRGCVTDALIEAVVRRSTEYLSGDVSIER